MKRLTLSRWLAVLTLAIALAPNTASVLEADTLNISGTFHMDQLTGTVGADLAEIFAHDNENTWSLTLFGITQSNEFIEYNGGDAEEFITRVHATSFDFGFSGPDADVLNEVISQQLTKSSLGDDLFLELSNIYSYTGLWPGGSIWDIGLLPLDDAAGVSFFAQGEGSIAVPNSTGVWFPAEYDFGYPYGFPIVEPQTIRSQSTSIHDSRLGSSGTLASIGGFVDLGLSIVNLPGDYNDNGIVDGADYTVWRDALAIGGTLTNDPTPGTVDESDFLYWRDHFGESLGSGAGAGHAAVPEPSSLALLAISLPLLVWRNSWRSVIGRMRAGRRFVLTTVTRALAGNDVHSFYFGPPWNGKMDHVAQ